MNRPIRRLALLASTLVMLSTACGNSGPDILPPDLSVSITPPNACVNVDGSLEFTATASGGHPPYTYTWDFGASGAAGSDLETPTATFAEKGKFEVNVTVTDNEGETASALVHVRVKDDCSLPVANIDLPAEDISVPVGQMVSFAGSATGGDLPYTYRWDFNPPGGGDATLVTDQNTSFAFDTEGEWLVRFSVLDNADDFGGDEMTVTVTEAEINTAIDLPITGVDGLSITAPFFAGLAGPLGWIMAYGQNGCVAIDFGTHTVVRVFAQSLSFLSGLVLSPPPLAADREGAREVLFGYDGSGTMISYWNVDTEEFGMVGFSPGGVSDAVPFGNDPASGGLLYTRPGVVTGLEYDAAGEWLLTSFWASTVQFPGLDGDLMSSFARDAGSYLVVSGGNPGQLYLAPRPVATATLIGEVGDTPRQVRCLGELCVISCFGSGELWTATWDDEDNVAIVTNVSVGDGPIGIDLLELGNGDIAVVSTGFNDNSYSITVFTPAGELVSNSTQPVPTECASPPHAVWVPGDTREILFTCNGSDNVFIIPSGL